MAKSFANGDYRLIMAIESGSRMGRWYRILQDKVTNELSCDCPSWTFRQDGGQVRSCKHTRLAQYSIAHMTQRLITDVTHPYLAAVRAQWPGLDGQWSLVETTAYSDNTPSQFFRLTLVTGNGDTAVGTIAFGGHHQTQQYLATNIAGWAGYAVAAEVARLAGYPLAGQPPEHFKVSASRLRTATGRARIGLQDILRLGDKEDLGDGLLPKQRAENTLMLFLGDELYGQLERQHFLDVSSVCYPGRVYRVRRDPAKERDRRVRVFINGTYANDYCIVRHQSVPEGDHWLTVFFGLISDEMRTISVVERHNIFSPHSDDWTGREEETIPAIWQPRTVA